MPERAADPAVGPPDERIAPGRTRWWRDARRRRMLAAADLVAAASAVLIAASGVSTLWALALLPGWVVLAKLIGLYDRDHRAIRHLTVDEAPQILAWAVGGSVGVSAFLSLTPEGSLSPGAIAEMAAVAATACFLLRVAARRAWRAITPVERCVVIGDGELAREIHRKLELFDEMHLQVSGEVDLDRSAENRSNGAGPDDLAALTEGIDRVILATSWPRPDMVGELSATCRDRQVKLSVVSPLRGRALPAPRISQVADLPVLEYNTWDVSRSTAVLKRCFDLAAGIVGLLLLVAVLAPIALAIKLDSRGPVFFRQLRAGRGSKPFRIIKFRTMREGAEDALDEVVRLEELEEPVFKLRDDPRRTRVGRFLRRFSLDELPQVLNVVRGEMSIVGPRPEQLELVDRYRPEHRFRLDLKPGMTGPMQVHGRGNLTFPERLAVELDYVENLSLGRDLRLLVLTLPAIVKQNGAY